MINCIFSRGLSFLVYLSVLSLVLPFQLLLNLPLLKIFSPLLLLSALFFYTVKRIFGSKQLVCTIDSFAVLLFSAILLLSSIFYFLDFYEINSVYITTSFVLSLQAILPIGFFFIPLFLSRTSLYKLLLFNSISYSIFGLVLVSTLFYFSLVYLPGVPLRDVPLLLDNVLQDTSGRLSFPSLYVFFGRSNTIAPAIALSCVSAIAFLPPAFSDSFSRFRLLLVALFLNVVTILTLNSRAALISLCIAFLFYFFYKFIKPSSYSFKISFLIVILLICFLVIFLGVDSRYTFDAFFADGRFEIIKSIFDSDVLSPLFGNGLFSAVYICSQYPVKYFDLYGTDFCTFHNAYLTSMHDLGIFGLLLLLYIVFRPLYLCFSHKLKKYSFSSNSHSLSTFNYSIVPFDCRIFGIFLTLVSSILLFFDSDILFVHPFFSCVYWLYLGSFYRFLSFKQSV